MDELKNIDHSAIVVSQATMIVLNLIAFVANQPWLVVFVAAMMLFGTLVGSPAFGFVYRLVLQPLGVVRPHLLKDNPEPHRFAQGLGWFFMSTAALCLFLGLPILGWILVWMVIFLAALNAFGGFCLGCFIYYWLARLGAPGFVKTPPSGVFPGMRPRRGSDER
ncbi:MAG: DUF4395 domain-containing protein [Anaerolineales bacterium]